MRSAAHNPPANKLPPGWDEAHLGKAIAESGYPLQGQVAAQLGPLFQVTEDWSHPDAESGKHRTLDIFASCELPGEQSKARPSAVLLVECKRSIHPYIFFATGTERPLVSFPRIAGLPGSQGRLSINSSRSTHFVPAGLVMGLDKLPFVAEGPAPSAAFTKAMHAKSGKIEFSGVDPYNSLMLPLAMASDFYFGLRKPHDNRAKTISPTLVLTLSVLDAPMLFVDSPDSAETPVLTPWLRVVRLEAGEVEFRFRTVDVVHAGFLGEYLERHLMPFMHEFARRARQRPEILMRGGTVKDPKNIDWDQIVAKPERA